MCGGCGSRLETEVEKPLFTVGGERMIDRVRAALVGSSIERTYAVVSPNAPKTRSYLKASSVELMETPGDGYVSDLGHALEDPRIDPPVLTVAADLPLLTATVVDELLDAYATEGVDPITATDEVSDGVDAEADPPSMTICTPRSHKEELGASIDTPHPSDDALVPAGINVVGSAAEAVTHVVTDPAIAVNVNRLEDASIAERWLQESADNT